MVYVPICLYAINYTLAPCSVALGTPLLHG